MSSIKCRSLTGYDITTPSRHLYLDNVERSSGKPVPSHSQTAGRGRPPTATGGSDQSPAGGARSTMSGAVAIASTHARSRSASVGRGTPRSVAGSRASAGSSAAHVIGAAAATVTAAAVGLRAAVYDKGLVRHSGKSGGGTAGGGTPGGSTRGGSRNWKSGRSASRAGGPSDTLPHSRWRLSAPVSSTSAGTAHSSPSARRTTGCAPSHWTDTACENARAKMHGRCTSLQTSTAHADAVRQMSASLWLHSARSSRHCRSAMPLGSQLRTWLGVAGVATGGCGAPSGGLGPSRPRSKPCMMSASASMPTSATTGIALSPSPSKSSRTATCRGSAAAPSAAVVGAGTGGPRSGGASASPAGPATGSGWCLKPHLPRLRPDRPCRHPWRVPRNGHHNAARSAAVWGWLLPQPPGHLRPKKSRHTAHTCACGRCLLEHLPVCMDVPPVHALTRGR